MTYLPSTRFKLAVAGGRQWYVSRWYQHASDIPDAVWNRCFPAALEGKDWYQTLEESELESQFSFHYLLISDSDGPAAIAPVFTMDLPLTILAPVGLQPILKLLQKITPSLVRVRTLFVGSPCAEEGTVGIIPGRNRPEILEQVHSQIENLSREKAISLIIWKDFNATDSELLTALSSDWGASRVPSYPGTQLHLPRGDFDSYLQSLKKSRRSNLKRKLTRSRNVLSLKSEVLVRPDDATLSSLFALYVNTYEKSATKFERLELSFFKKMAEKRQTRFLLLRDATTNRIVAFRLFFEMEGKIINKFIGVDYSLDKECFILFRLVEEGIRYAMKHNVPQIQSGQTCYGAKMETGHLLVPLYNFVRHRNCLLNMAVQFWTRSCTWASLDDELAKYLAAHPEALPAETFTTGLRLVAKKV